MLIAKRMKDERNIVLVSFIKNKGDEKPSSVKQIPADLSVSLSMAQVLQGPCWY
jgi:hypothetical protein